MGSFFERFTSMPLNKKLEINIITKYPLRKKQIAATCNDTAMCRLTLVSISGSEAGDLVLVSSLQERRQQNIDLEMRHLRSTEKPSMQF